MTNREKNYRYLCRYTSLPFLLDILCNKRLTLVDPNSWEDKNDAYFINLYKRRAKKVTVLALCFFQYTSPGVEKYLHWKAYAGNISGVSILFYKEKLLKYLINIKDIYYRPVNYLSYSDLNNSVQEREWTELPYIKRLAFSSDNEFRILYESKIFTDQIKYIDIGLDCIKKITLNPWLIYSSNESIYKVLKIIDGCQNISFATTKMLNYKKWQLLGDQISKRSQSIIN
ncbi:MAG: DUF2971 domain-containing protein [Anaerolineaceae bacterium]